MGWGDSIVKERNYTKGKPKQEASEKILQHKKELKKEACFHLNSSFLVSITSCLRHGAHCLNFVMLELVLLKN